MLNDCAFTSNLKAIFRRPASELEILQLVGDFGIDSSVLLHTDLLNGIKVANDFDLSRTPRIFLRNPSTKVVWLVFNIEFSNQDANKNMKTPILPTMSCQRSYILRYDQGSFSARN